MLLVPALVAHLDPGQAAEVLELRGRPMDATYLENLINLSEFLWYEKRGDFICLYGLQPTDMLNYNCWLATTVGLAENVRLVIRAGRALHRFWERVVGPGYTATAIIPPRFDKAIHFAEHMGLRGSAGVMVVETED